MKRVFKFGIALLMVHAAPAAFDAATAFDVFKGLQGQWAIQSAGKTLLIQMTYEVGSNGSIVTERFGKELSVFYHDGPELAMIHFCNAGNQPRLKFEKESSSPTVLNFETVDVTNLSKADAAHVQRIIYTIVNNKRLEIEIVWGHGKSRESERYRLDKI